MKSGIWVAPAVLAVAFALWSYWPAPDSWIGWGGDPLFNLWTFEVGWHNLAAREPLWQAPLYAGSSLGLAYSETQIVPALLLWPVRALTGNGAVALGVGAILTSLLAFICAAGWLRSLGVPRLAAFGGLIFAACGWLQSQYAHYQNLCIFVLPLALWSWSAYRRDPRPLRLMACAAAFGWIAGWNLYFQIFADLCLVVLAAKARRPAVVALALALQAPFLAPYAALGPVLGGYGISTTYGAGLVSFLGSTMRPRLLMPSFDVPVEAAGYLGIVWLALMALSSRREQGRPWLVAAALAFWFALGRGYGLYDALALLPGISALRAIGRAQILVLLFSLPAVLGWLETLSPRRVLAAACAAVLDLCPASRPLRTFTDPQLWGPPSPLSRELCCSREPVLVVPTAHERFMLYATQTWTPYFGGVSGREPPGQALLQRLERDGRLEEVLEMSGARRVLALPSEAAARLRSIPELQPRGCFRHLDLGEPCLFDVRGNKPEPLRIDRDTHWEPLPSMQWPAADLRADKSGVLDARRLDGCRLRQQIRLLGLPWSGEVALPVPERARYSAGEAVLHVEASQWIFRSGAATARFTVVCEP